jgi:hypothetical protein
MATSDVTKRRIAKLGGEFLRDAALLVLVFYPFDLYLQDRTLTLLQGGLTLLFSAVVWGLGVVLDVKASND